MQPNRCALALIVAAVAAQAAPAQKPLVDPGVSLVVTAANGTAGFECETFLPHPLDVPVMAGEGILVDLFGLGDHPYLLLAGMPPAHPNDIPGIAGQLVMDLPLVILDYGMVPASGTPGPCGMNRIMRKIEVPWNAPFGAQLVLQALAVRVAPAEWTFSRAVQLTVM